MGHEDEGEPGDTVGMEPDFTSLRKPGRGQTRYFRPMFLNALPTHKHGASSWELSATRIFGANHSLTQELKQTWMYFGEEYKIGMAFTIK